MVLVAAGVVVFVVTRPDDAAAGEIFLEGASSTGTDPFGSLPGPAIPVTTNSTATTTPTAQGATTAVRSVSGGQRGLYGGTLNSGRCDPEGQIAFLAANPAMANAFASALNRTRPCGGAVATRSRGPAAELHPGARVVTLVTDTESPTPPTATRRRPGRRCSRPVPR